MVRIARARAIAKRLLSDASEREHRFVCAGERQRSRTLERGGLLDESLTPAMGVREIHERP